MEKESGRHSPEAIFEKEVRRSLRKGFALIFMKCDDEKRREKLIPRINQWVATSTTIAITPDMAWWDFEDTLVARAGHEAIHVMGWDAWKNESKYNGVNYHRDLIAKKVPTNILLWMTDDNISQFALRAADTWAWRLGVVDCNSVEVDANCASDLPPELPMKSAFPQVLTAKRLDS